MRSTKDEIRGALVQLTRQKPEDRYDYKAVIAAIKAALPGIPVVTDDNYAALKVDAIGARRGPTCPPSPASRSLVRRASVQ